MSRFEYILFFDRSQRSSDLDARIQSLFQQYGAQPTIRVVYTWTREGQGLYRGTILPALVSVDLATKKMITSTGQAIDQWMSEFAKWCVEEVRRSQMQEAQAQAVPPTKAAHQHRDQDTGRPTEKRRTAPDARMSGTSSYRDEAARRNQMTNKGVDEAEARRIALARISRKRASDAPPVSTVIQPDWEDRSGYDAQGLWHQGSSTAPNIGASTKMEGDSVLPGDNKNKLVKAMGAVQLKGTKSGDRTDSNVYFKNAQPR